MGRWDLVQFTHRLPEWKDPQGSSVPISIHELLRGAGLDEDAIDAAMRRWQRTICWRSWSAIAERCGLRRGRCSARNS